MEDHRVLLAMMPFWSPLTPPLGISVLSGYLRARGYDVRTCDFNARPELWSVQQAYFGTLKRSIPEDRHSNLNMIALEVLTNHLMAWQHKENESRYEALVKALVRESFFTEICTDTVRSLDGILSDFFVRLLDACVELFQRVRPSVFGVSCYNSSLPCSLFALRTMKQRHPEVQTLLGGGVYADLLRPTAPDFPRFLEKTEPYLDKLIVGEGEKLLHHFLRGDLDPKERVHTLDDLSSLPNRDGALLDLDREAALPDFSEFELGRYMMMTCYASRGCPFHCSFCSEVLQWKRFRTKKADLTVSEIVALRERYGGRLFMLSDSLTNPIIDDFSRKLIEDDVGIYWDGYLRADPEVCEPERVRLWRRGGFYRARLGIESGSEHVLGLMKKETTPPQIRRALSNLASTGTKTTTYWVVGHPGETDADFQETLDLIEEVGDSIYEVDFHPFTFFPQGQVRSKSWKREHDVVPLYPDEFEDMLLVQSWQLEAEPGREETFERMNRLRATCQRLGIPNPYSALEIYQADERWKALHAGAGPGALELHNANSVRPAAA